MSAPNKQTKDLSSMAPGDHIALTGKPGTLIWVGRQNFNLNGQIKTLFSPEELMNEDKIIISGLGEAWLLRENGLYLVRLFNIPMVHFSSLGRLSPFQRCIWNGYLTPCSCPNLKIAILGQVEKIGEDIIQSLLRSCEILPACDDYSEWRVLSSPKGGKSDFVVQVASKHSDIENEPNASTKRDCQRESTSRHYQS